MAMKRARSRRKRELVTLICRSGFEANVERPTTTVEINRADPSRGLIVVTASSLPADIAVNRSGAPFPNARIVTPARDSEIPNLMVMYSRDGDKYSSAVVLRHLIKMNIIASPIGKKI